MHAAGLQLEDNIMKNRFFLTGIGSGALLATASAQATIINLIDNGEFEGPTPPNDDPYTASFPTWTYEEYDYDGNILSSGHDLEIKRQALLEI